MDLTFKQWLKQVNSLVESRCGMGIYDLPDAPYRDMYDDGLTPEEMCEVVLEEAAEHFPF